MNAALFVVMTAQPMALQDPLEMNEKPEIASAAPQSTTVTINSGTLIKLLLAALGLMFLTLILVVGGGVWFVMTHQGGAPSPTPAALEAQIRQAMPGPHASADAAFLAVCADSVADTVQFDSSLPQPRISGNKQADDLANTLGAYASQYLQGDYPQIGGVIAQYTKSQVPDSPTLNKPLVIATYRSLAQAFRDAAK